MKFNRFDFLANCKESERIKVKYPTRMPIIVNDSFLKNKLTKHKYLVPNDLTCGEFMYIIRSRLELNNEEALFMNIQKHIPSNSSLMADQQVDPDGFMYVDLRLENTFGTYLNK